VTAIYFSCQACSVTVKTDWPLLNESQRDWLLCLNCFWNHHITMEQERELRKNAGAFWAVHEVNLYVDTWREFHEYIDRLSI
jgi:hypothetical protein